MLGCSRFFFFKFLSRKKKSFYPPESSFTTKIQKLEGSEKGEGTCRKIVR